MDFDLTDDQRRRYDELVEAIGDRLGGGPALDVEAGMRTKWKQAAALGLVGLCLPTEFGGGGCGAFDTALSLKAFGRACADTGLVFAVAAHLLACAIPIRDFAGDAVRAGLLAGLASGDLIAANAMTEPGAGSDIGRLRATAVLDGDEYVLDGVKSFVSNAPVADVLVTYATTDATAGFLGISAFVVPRTLPGVTVSGPLAKMGLDGCLAGQVEFDGCRVPKDHLLGVEGHGAAIFQHSMGWERACLFAGYVGLMDGQLERCVGHARERRQFGRRLGDFQAISHRIAG